ncbi:MAG: response regulator transcription factor [Verrucomicrobiota bacterium]|jgi:two-component system, NarL family, response regulator DevR
MSPAKPMTNKPIRVLLVDDHDVVRAGLRALLSTAPHIQVIGEERTAIGAVTAAKCLAPDVVILDLRLPDGDGFSACQQIKQARAKTGVLVLTSVADDQTILAAIRSGADGYLLKDVVGVDMVGAVEKIASGGSLLDPVTTRRVMEQLRSGSSTSGAAKSQRLEELSAQEMRVLAEVAKGRTDKEVAETLHLSAKTVRNYLDNIFSKLGVNSRTQAALVYERSRSSLERGG